MRAVKQAFHMQAKGRAGEDACPTRRVGTAGEDACPARIRGTRRMGAGSGDACPTRPLSSLHGLQAFMSAAFCVSCSESPVFSILPERRPPYLQFFMFHVQEGSAFLIVPEAKASLFAVLYVSCSGRACLLNPSRGAGIPVCSPSCFI